MDPYYHHQNHTALQEGMWWSFPRSFSGIAGQTCWNPIYTVEVPSFRQGWGWSKPEWSLTVGCQIHSPLIRLLGYVCRFGLGEIGLWTSIRCWMRWGWEPGWRLVGLKWRQIELSGIPSPSCKNNGILGTLFIPSNFTEPMSKCFFKIRSLVANDLPFELISYTFMDCVMKGRNLLSWLSLFGLNCQRWHALPSFGQLKIWHPLIV